MRELYIRFCCLVMAALLGILQGCTFSNNLGLGDYVQHPTAAKAPKSAPKAGFYVTCTSIARNYDQVVKATPCSSLSLTSIFDLSVQQEVLGNFKSLRFDDTLDSINTLRPESADLSKNVHLHIYQEYGWPRLAFQGILSTLTLTLLPLNYPREYTITLSIENMDGTVEKSASRKVAMDNWWWMPLMFAYPFYNERRASENILLHTGRDLVQELEHQP